jgi:hypothetical protein
MTLDDELHDVMRRAAAGTRPDVDAGWQAVRRQAGAPRGRGRLVLVAAAVLVVLAGLTTVFVTGDDGQDVTTDAPATSTTQAPTTTTEHIEPTTTTTNRPVDRPPEAVVATDDGRLIVLNTSTGKELRELVALALPGAPPPVEEAGRSSVDGLTMTTTGSVETVYYSVCCEPAAGTTYAVPLAGGEPTRVGIGFQPDIDAVNQSLVLSTGQGLLLHEVGVSSPVDVPIESPAAALGTISDPIWTSRASLAFTVLDADRPALGFGPLGADLQATLVSAPDGQSWTNPVPWRVESDELAVLVAEQCCGVDPTTYDGPAQAVVISAIDGEELDRPFGYSGAVVDQHLSSSGEWLLVTYADGRLEARNVDTGTVEEIATGVVHAAW